MRGEIASVDDSSAAHCARGPLSGIQLVEIEGLGPAPFCGMLLADLGATVTVVERPGKRDAAHGDLVMRGKKRVEIDLKAPGGRDAVLELVRDADGLIEGMRPGVMERLGLGPDVCLEMNPRLVFGRMTGWGQSGPLSHSAGHDINYVALAGAAWYAGAPGDRRIPPPTLVGDIGGGSLYLAVGMLSAILFAKQTGKGQVVDAAIVDGLAHMQTLLLSLAAVKQLPEQRGESWIDGAPWYGIYSCKDGKEVSIGALESPFYRDLMNRLDLIDLFPAEVQFDQREWPAMRVALANKFSSEPQDHWCRLLEGTDACFAPVLSPREAATHRHNLRRGNFQMKNGQVSPATAPRFSLFPQHADRETADAA